MLTIICPYCEARFCSQHHKPEKHNCPAKNELNTKTTENSLENNEHNHQLTQNNNLPIINKANDSESNSNVHARAKEEPIVEESIDIVKAKTQAVLASIIGVQKKNEDFDEEEQNRYNKIYEYFLKAWKQNLKLKKENEKLSAELDSIKAELELITSEHEKLLKEYKPKTEK
jgi:hypothetical protein